MGEAGGAVYRTTKIRHEGSKCAPKTLTADDVRSMVRAVLADGRRDRHHGGDVKPCVQSGRAKLSLRVRVCERAVRECVCVVVLS